MEESSEVVKLVKRWQKDLSARRLSEKKLESLRWGLWGLCTSLRERFGGELAKEREAWRLLLETPLQNLRNRIFAHSHEMHKEAALIVLGELMQTLGMGGESETVRQTELQGMEDKLFD